MPVWAGTFVSLLEKNGLAVPQNMVRDITPLGNAGAARFCVEHGLKMTSDEILSYVLNEFNTAYPAKVPLKSNVKDTLIKLRDNGISLHVLTASSHSYVDVLLKNEEIFGLFENVWSTDDFSLSKSDTRIYKSVTDKLSAPPEACTLFDDNIIALSTAKKAGISAIGVYDSSSSQLVEQIRAITDGYIYDFSQIQI